MVPSRGRRPIKLSVMAAAAFLAACGGGGDDAPLTVETPPPSTPTLSCAVNAGVELAYEEKRLETPLPFSGANVVGSDQTPFATRILKETGFDQFAPEFQTRLCADGQTTVTSYEQALDVVKTEGAKLWKAAVDRAQGRRASPAGSIIPASDDRMLYWARVQMTKVLRQWSPNFSMTPEQKEELQWQFERSSRGQYDINLPEGNTADGRRYRRMIISGFDVFTLGTPGTPSTGLRNGNPSGATALALDGKEFTLDDGSVLRIEAYVLPVSYDPFNKGMQEETLAPYFLPGPKRVDASISISQGGSNQFWLEQWNGRFHGPSAGNDGKIYCPSSFPRLPNTILPIGTQSSTSSVPPEVITLPNSGCDVYPPQKWLGYASVPWMKDFPPQFTVATLPMPAMVTGNTQAGVTRPPGATSQGTQGFDVTWHTNYSYFPDCTQTPTTSVPSNNVMNSMPDVSTVTPPPATGCSRSGGGGDYLSNESAYRNTLLRDVFGLDIPAGHIHIPVMNNYNTPTTTGLPRDDNAITDARFEAYRTAIVQQTANLLRVVGNSLVFH